VEGVFEEEEEDVLLLLGIAVEVVAEGVVVAVAVGFTDRVVGTWLWAEAVGDA